MKVSNRVLSRSQHDLRMRGHALWVMMATLLTLIFTVSLRDLDDLATRVLASALPHLDDLSATLVVSLWCLYFLSDLKGMDDRLAQRFLRDMS